MFKCGLHITGVTDASIIVGWMYMLNLDGWFKYCIKP